MKQVIINKIILENIVVAEEEYQKINQTNENFKKKVKNLYNGLEILKLLGFEEDNGFLIINIPKSSLLKKAVQFLKTIKIN